MITLLCVACTLIIPISSSAYAGGSDSKPVIDGREYAQNVREYSKELVTAVFAVKWCNEYDLELNNQYFNFKSPGIKWDQKRYDTFTEEAMRKTRKIIDAQYARLGHHGYCRTYIEFAKRNRTYFGLAVVLPTK